MGYCVGYDDVKSTKALYHKHYATIERILSRAATLIATLPGEPDVILGYLVVEKLEDPQARPVVHFLYVKGPWRGNGVAKFLMGDLDPNKCVCSHLSRAVQDRLDDFPGLVYAPRYAR